MAPQKLCFKSSIRNAKVDINGFDNKRYTLLLLTDFKRHNHKEPQTIEHRKVVQNNKFRR